jgi:hypothetical protein
MAKKCNHRVGDIVYYIDIYTCKKMYGKIESINDLDEYDFECYPDLEPWEKRIKARWTNSIKRAEELHNDKSHPNGWMNSAEVFPTIGYQSPLWKVLNGESIEGEE